MVKCNDKKLRERGEKDYKKQKAKRKTRINRNVIFWSGHSHSNHKHNGTVLAHTESARVSLSAATTGGNYLN